MEKADIVQLQKNGEPKYVATHANASLGGTGNETAFHSHASSLYETSHVEGSTHDKKELGGQIFN